MVRARTAGGPVPCPRCGGLAGHVHGYCERTVADVPADGRPVVLHVRVRRMRCPALDCPVQTFREQVPGLLDRYQRRTTRLTLQVSAVALQLAGRGGAALLTALGVPLSRHTSLRTLLAIPLPGMSVPRVLGVDDFALRRGQVYASILIDAETGDRVDVLPGRTADVVEAWLRDHPGVQIICRDGIRRIRRGGAPRGTRRCPGRGPVAPVARPGRGRPEGGCGARLVLGRGRPAGQGRQAGRDDRRAVAGSPRSAGQGHRPAGMLAAARPVTEHRQAVCPRHRA